ncbi:hypothetical protein FRC09_020096 [Ceratobasidium sp. 395]|nr:hypothetical protein FRC09_020096 [Ceratobasidium sp. 395]
MNLVANPPGTLLEHATAQSKEHQTKLLTKLGSTRRAVKSVIDFGRPIMELLPIAEATLNVFDEAWEKLKTQGQCDESVDHLIDGLSSILSPVTAVKDEAMLPGLGQTVASILRLIEDASRFVIEYYAEGGIGQKVLAMVNSTAQAKVDELLEKLRNLKEDFDRWIHVQSLLNSRYGLLDKLKLANNASYDPSRACLPGTREVIITNIVDWCNSSSNTDNFLWVHGHAGLGKSTIATSVCQRLQDQRVLAASFFCKRDDEARRDPQRVLTTIIRGLAQWHPGYAQALVFAIQSDNSVCSAPMQTQYNKLVGDLFSYPTVLARGDSLVFVVDALDECGDLTTRRQILEHLHTMSHTVDWLRVVVTSRPDKDIKDYFDSVSQVSKRDVHDYDASQDIQMFIHRRLSKSGRSKSLPSDAELNLVKKADGLFIWAQTACEFVLRGVEPAERLRLLLQEAAKASTISSLDILYSIAIENSFGDMGGDNLRSITQCIGTIAACSARTPLPISTLCELLGHRVKESVIKHVVDSLGAVLYADKTGAVRAYHASFLDYLNTRTSTDRLFIDLPARNLELAEGCLDTMKAKLKFNICGLATSYKRNDEISNLNELVQKSISAALQYSSVYWTSHLSQAKQSVSLSQWEERLDELLNGPVVLYWVETLSLMGKLDATLSAFRDLSNLRKSEKHSRVINDLERFIQAFYLPVSSSTPHLYISGIALLPTATVLAQDMRKYFPNTLRVIQGEQRNWSRLLHCIVAEAAVHCVGVSPDGRLIVSSSGYNTAQLWDADTGAPRGKPINGHSSTVVSVAFSPDGRRIVSGSYDNTVRVWDADTGAAVGNPLTGHSKWVYAVAFSPDGRRIVSGSRDNTVRVWDADTGAAVGDPLTDHSDHVTSVAFSPDGRRIVSSSLDGTVRVWDAATGAAVGDPLTGPHSNKVAFVALSPDGRRIVSGSLDYKARVWDAATGAAVGDPLTGHSSWVRSVAFSPDGRRIVSGSDDNTVRVWDADTGAAVGNPLTGHSKWVYAVAFSPDGRRIVSGSRDNTVRVWDADTGAAVGDPLTDHSDHVTSVAFSPDGRRIVSSSLDGTVRVWDAATGAAVGDPLTGPHSNKVAFVALSPDGRRIVSGSLDYKARVWDAATGAAVGDPLTGHSSWVRSVAFSPDGRRIVSGSDDNTVRVWDADTGAAVGNPLTGHSKWVYAVAFSPDGRRIVSGSWDRTVRVWDAATGAAVGDPLTGHSSLVTSVAFSPDGRRIVSGSDDNTVRVWDAATGAAVGNPLTGHSKWVDAVAFSPDGRRIVSGSRDNTVRVWDVDTCAAVGDPFAGHPSAVTSVAFSPDSRRIVTGSEDKTVRLWDADTGAAVGDPLTGHSGWVTSVAFSPDCRRIVSGSYDKTVRVWDAATGAAVGEPLAGHLSTVTSVALSPDCRRIVSGSYDETVRVWDAATGAAVGDPLAGHSSGVISVAFSPDGRRIVSGSDDKTVRVWDAATGAAVGNPLTGHANAVTCVAFSPDGRRIVSGSWDKTVRVWDATIHLLADQPSTNPRAYVDFTLFSSGLHDPLTSGSTLAYTRNIVDKVTLARFTFLRMVGFTYLTENSSFGSRQIIGVLA